MLILLVTVFLLLSYAFLLFFYYHHWQRLPEYSAGTAAPRTPLSIVVAARNEAENLPRLMAALQAQTYPAHFFEVIVVDDFSTDETASVVAPFLNGRIRMIRPNVPADASSKKKAITAGIAQAVNNLIVITDADCIPPPQWLHTMAAFQETKQGSFIAAPVQFRRKGSLLHIFQALDFMTLQGITAASVSAKFNSMCNGANLAYKKSSFAAVNGFAGIDQVASGDDMLLMHKIRTREPDAVHYLKSRQAIVSTQPMPDWKSLLQQRRRWASKTIHYEDKKIQLTLFFVYLFNFWFLVLLVSFLVTGYGIPLLLYLVAKTVGEWFFVQSVARFYHEEKILPWLAVLQPMHILYIIITGISSQLGSYEWKGRKTN
jgi:cellulose synthase/poly-beta-1,6-N-acetylglucosamine synthase-like glycosyltransferase